MNATRPVPVTIGIGVLGRPKDIDHIVHGRANYYGATAGRVCALTEIQAQIPSDAALLAWVDLPGNPRAANPAGEHWACVVAHEGEPGWVRLPGSGPDGVWTSADDELPRKARFALSTPSANSSELNAALSALHRQRIVSVECLLNEDVQPRSVRHLIVLPTGMGGIPVEALTDQYTISYAPSGSMHAWLRAARPQGPDHAAGLFALGDPLFKRPTDGGEPHATPPDNGALVTAVGGGSAGQSAGLRVGDVIVAYARHPLNSGQDYLAAVAQAEHNAHAGAAPGVVLEICREGQTLALHVPSGELGVQIAQAPASQILQADYRLDAALRAARGGAFAALPGTRLEVTQIVDRFRASSPGPTVTLLLAEQASEESLDALATSGTLATYRYIHLATHALIDDRVAMRSALILAPPDSSSQLERAITGKPVYDGRVTAEQIIRSWKLNADLVTLSACQTALGQAVGGEGFIGLSQALLVAGARSVLASLWKVDDTATALLMMRFYENLWGQYDEPRNGFSPRSRQPKAEALREAKIWLRGLTAEECRTLCHRYELPLPAQARGETGNLGPPIGPHGRLFERPYYWSAFILIGAPD